MEFVLEEHLSDADFTAGTEVNASAWLVRSVRQEVLGPEVDQYFKVENARILSIAIEEPIFNPFLVAYIPAECDSVQLAEMLPNAPDRAEWLRYAFYAADLPLGLLAHAFRENKHANGNLLHPTSRYRTYMLWSELVPPSVASVCELLAKGQD